jgi:hypothetical protein
MVTQQDIKDLRDYLNKKKSSALKTKRTEYIYNIVDELCLIYEMKYDL